MRANVVPVIAAGNFVGDTTKAGGKSVGIEQKGQNQTGGQ
jgi:hypothetical protein